MCCSGCEIWCKKEKTLSLGKPALSEDDKDVLHSLVASFIQHIYDKVRQKAMQLPEVRAVSREKACQGSA